MLHVAVTVFLSWCKKYSVVTHMLSVGFFSPRSSGGSVISASVTVTAVLDQDHGCICLRLATKTVFVFWSETEGPFKKNSKKKKIRSCLSSITDMVDVREIAEIRENQIFF